MYDSLGEIPFIFTNASSDLRKNLAGPPPQWQLLSTHCVGVVTAYLELIRSCNYVLAITEVPDSWQRVLKTCPKYRMIFKHKKQLTTQMKTRKIIMIFFKKFQYLMIFQNRVPNVLQNSEKSSSMAKNWGKWRKSCNYFNGHFWNPKCSQWSRRQQYL